VGAQRGYGIARRIEQLSRDVLRLNEGTVYTALLRLQQQGWIAFSSPAYCGWLLEVTCDGACVGIRREG
jgi:hypothetical protein